VSAATILVIEDNPLTRKMLRVTLESDGYQVIEAGDGRAGFEAVRRRMPDLVLQDLVLPDMSGFELIRQLRELAGAELPIIALSGFFGRIEEARGIDAGFTALLLKPVEPAGLLETLRPYLPTRQQLAPLGGGCRVLVIDDDRVQLKLSRLYLEQAGFEVIVAESAAEGMRLARAERPDVLLSDVLMADSDGFQLCLEIRHDPELSSLPVVLASAWYGSRDDGELARRVGANALIERAPEFAGVGEALLAALAEGAPPPVDEPSVEVRLEHAQAVIRQLERQVAVRTDLARRCSLQAAKIALLSGVADALAGNSNSEAALGDVLAATLDAAGISKGALFLRDRDGALVVRHAIGFTPSERARLAGFFDHLEVLEDAVEHQKTMSIPSPAFPASAAGSLFDRVEARSAQIVPLVSDGRGVGAMFLAARRTDVTNEDAIAFARAMGNQIAQSLELSSSVRRLMTSEQRYRTVTEAASDAIAILRPGGEILEVNPSLARSLGLPRDQIVGRHIRDFAAPGHADENVEIYTRSIAGPGGRRPVRLRAAGGATVLMEFSSKRVEVRGEELVFSIGRDVTEQIKAQAQLMEFDRMASIGTLAAGVAHEINNPLMATIANLEFAVNETRELAAKLGSGALGTLEESLSDASEGADRVRVIVRDLKVFSRAEEDTRGAVDVCRVLESSVRLSWNEIRHRARLVKELDPVPLVDANESRLGQVFVNLLVNAAQAIPAGHADQNQIWVRTRSEGEGWVIVEVEDSGPGVGPELLKRIFTPFFTTKPRGVGTGLGLSISQRIVTAIGGSITVESEAGRGTLFRVSLPATGEGATAAREIAPPPVIAPRRRGKLLIIDDEPMIASAIRRMFASEHEVVALSSAVEALERIEAGEVFDVILCDLMMPEMSGSEFYTALHQRLSEQAERIIFITGGAFTLRAREFLDRVPNARLHKPFEIADLRALVNERVR
jgi:PAS domain S-box-containing protein